MRRGRDLYLGETVYLVPATIGCPAVCYRRPRGTFVRFDCPYIVVRLDAGQEVRVHEDNVVRRLPPPPKPRRAAPASRIAPEHGEEHSLW